MAHLNSGGSLGKIVVIAEMDERTYFVLDPSIELVAGPSPVAIFEARVGARVRVGVHFNPPQQRREVQTEVRSRDGARQRAQVQRLAPRDGSAVVDVGYEIMGKGAWIPLTGPDRPKWIAFDTAKGQFAIEFGASGEARLFRTTGSKREVTRWTPQPAEVLSTGRPLDNAPIGDASEVTSAVAVLGQETLHTAMANGYENAASTSALSAQAQFGHAGR